MLYREHGTPARDRAELPERMRRDVRLLGDILGEVIRDSDPKTGPDLLADVERLRHAVIEARDQERRDGDPAGDAIAALVASWDLDRAEQVARAFTVYFHLANLAEEHQRIRQLRERDAGPEPVRESLAAAVTELTRDAGPAYLGELRVHLVLTAHPTEARRRAVVAVLRRISELLSITDDERAGAAEHAEARRGLRENIDLLWRTSQLRVKAMDPIDEVRTVMTAFDETLFRVVPAVYRELDRALDEPESKPVPAYLRFGSWVGADRDGNPFVTAQVTRETATIQADHILRALEAATARTGRALTVHEATTPPSAGLRRALAAAAAAHPELLAEIAARSPQEPYRTYLLYAAARINATRMRNADLAYPGPDVFLKDLRVVQESLAAAGAVMQAFGELQNLIWQAETFGFHLAGLEVRQHSEVHARVLRELRAAGPPDMETGPEVHAGNAGGAGHLPGHRLDPGPVRRGRVPALRGQLHPVGRRHRRGLRARQLRGRGRPDPGARRGAAVRERGRPGQRARGAHRHARTPAGGRTPERHRRAPGGDARLLRLGQGTRPGQRHPAAVRHPGPAGRMGCRTQDPAHLVPRPRRRAGPGRRAGRAGGAGPGARLGQRVVQGHRAGRGDLRPVRPAGHRQAAPGTGQLRGPARLVAAPGRAARRRRRPGKHRRRGGHYGSIAGRIDKAACAAFRGLVEADGFAEWFARISPLGEIGGLRIGSRPAKRGLHQGAPAMDLNDLRAIPWVFAWSQTRVNLPGWFGLGSGLAAIEADPDGTGVLRRAYREWPLFGVLLDNAEMSLAKTDRPIASRYLALGGRDDLTALVLAEYDLTKRLVLAVTGHDRLLADRPVLSRAVALRDPYVDALSYLQLRALAALRGPVR